MWLLREIDDQTGARGFRHDINALRAIAFVSVLLYHFRVPGFHGGFAGVDMFLVISGYLMMSIISRQAEAGRFRLVEFYSRRIARLAAPILFVTLATFAAGWFLLPPSLFETLGKHAIGTLSFTSNVMFWKESGYFDAANATKFLLHTWSLSLEVQFYLVFPLIFFLAAALFPRRGTLLPFAVLALAGFATSVIATQFKPVPAFFLLPPRLWEFIVGAIVFQLSRHGSGVWTMPALHHVGLALLAVSVVWLSGTMPWPGWRAALPVLGTALVILSNHEPRRLYRSLPVRFLGVVSYSGYLWHWPIVVLLVISDRIDDPVFQAGGIVLALVLAAVTWVLAERRLGRWLQGLNDRGRVAALAAVLGAAALAPVLALGTDGFPSRFTPAQNAFFDTAEHRPETRFCSDTITAHCVTKDLAPALAQAMPELGAIIIGDSHAGMISQIVADALPEGRSQLLSLAHPACPTIRGIEVNLDLSGTCAASVEPLLSLRALYPDVPVVVANRYAFYFEGPNETKRGTSPNYAPAGTDGSWSEVYIAAMAQGYADTLCPIAEAGPTLLVRPFPEFDAAVPPRISVETVVRGQFRDATLTRAAYEARNANVLPMIDKLVGACGARDADPFATLCPGGICTGTRDGHILYTDSNHLSASGAALVADVLSRSVRVALAQGSAKAEASDR